VIRILIILLFISSVSISQPLTSFEKSEGRETGTYAEVISFYRNLNQMYPGKTSLLKMGMTDSGEPLHLFILSNEKISDSTELGSTAAIRLLINNGIHPGEPDGIEASMMLARDLLASDELPDGLIICVIPVYNIGGALNRNSTSRVNQNGPEAYGFRGNARNFDLNRDFIKADTRNTFAFYEIFHLVQPDLFIDTHVSNGADYQYAITHLATQHNRIGGRMGTYIHDEFTPRLEDMMASKGHRITPYVNVFNRTPDERGFTQFMDAPRYSTGYTSLFGTLGFMIETHMLKPFDLRVAATYAFLENFIDLAKTDGEKIRSLRREVIESIRPGIMHPIDWRLNDQQSREISFAGYEGTMIDSEVTGQKRLKYDKSRPFERKIPYYDTYEPVLEVQVPSAYIVPQGWHGIIDRLVANGAVYERLPEDTTLNVESYRIGSFSSSSTPYEGHFPHRELTIGKSIHNVDFRAGDFIFPIPQYAGRFLVETLEPLATDSYFRWNFFDTILQQKEGFSPYVFEDLARDILAEQPDLKERLEKKKQEDESFASNWYLQLNFIYENSAYRETPHNQYPVYRIVK